MIKRATIVVAAFFVLGANAALAEDKKPAKTTSATSESAIVPLLESTAAPYVVLRADIANIEMAGMGSAKAMRDAHNLLASHNPEKITAAYVAYAALVAADVDAFAAAIEARTKKPKLRTAFIEELKMNPAMVRDLAGAEAAISAIMETSARDATRIGSLGQAYIDNAYSMQQKAWARKKIASTGMTRVNGAEKWAKNRPWPAVTARPAIRSAAGNVRPNLTAETDWAMTWSEDLTPPRPDSKSGMLMSQALVLATHYAVGDLTEGHLREYAHSKPTNRCFINAKLNFDQCIGATRTPYEEAFCIGTHGLKDISSCVGWPASAGVN